VIVLPRYMDTQVHKSCNISLQRLNLKMKHLCIHFVKKVFLLPQYADTHYTMTSLYLCICVGYFFAGIERQFSVSLEYL
jgi:hypothetical protein